MNLIKKITFSLSEYGYTFLLSLLICAMPIVINAQFTDITAALTGVMYSSVAWGDYDNDGDLDILLTGYTSTSACISKVYRNDAGNFTDIAAALTGVNLSSVAWGDYDNDGDLDILLTGQTPTYADIAKVYRNDAGTFTDVAATLTGVYYSSVAWGDYDNDGDLDILLTGKTVTSADITKVYRNDAGTFTDIAANLAGAYRGSVAWGDYDNDGDLDILLTGYNGSYISKVYRNDAGIFTDIAAPLTGVYRSSAAWGDYDNDGDLDILLTGDADGIYTSKVYRNNSGIFTDITAPLIGVMYSSAAWGDYDNDGDLDILLTGYSPSYISKVYRNDAGTFTDIAAALTEVFLGSVAWGDYDNDGDLDILLTGYSPSHISKVYRNDSISINTVPATPSNLRTSTDGEHVIFQWDAATDTQTPSTGLNYVLRIGTTPMGLQVSSPMANSNGYRLIPIMGYANSTCSWKIKMSPALADFYWSVQALDGAFAGSAFAPEQFVHINVNPTISLLSQETLQFGNKWVNEFTEWQEVKIKDIGLGELTIDSLYFQTTSSQFEYVYNNSGNPIPPGVIDTIYVRFSPTTIGTINDTLYIASDALNIPILKISLWGTGIYVPPSSPENVLITMQGQDNYDALVTWDAVTTDTHGNPLTPNYYFIYFNGSDNTGGLYYFLGLSYTTQYTHSNVGLGAEHMFYMVTAIKIYSRETADIILSKLRKGMTEAEVDELLKTVVK